MQAEKLPSSAQTAARRAAVQSGFRESTHSPGSGAYSEGSQDPEYDSEGNEIDPDDDLDSRYGRRAGNPYASASPSEEEDEESEEDPSPSQNMPMPSGTAPSPQAGPAEGTPAQGPPAGTQQAVPRYQAMLAGRTPYARPGAFSVASALGQPPAGSPQQPGLYMPAQGQPFIPSSQHGAALLRRQQQLVAAIAQHQAAIASSQQQPGSCASPAGVQALAAEAQLGAPQTARSLQPHSSGPVKQEPGEAAALPQASQPGVMQPIGSTHLRVKAEPGLARLRDFQQIWSYTMPGDEVKTEQVGLL